MLAPKNLTLNPPPFLVSSVEGTLDEDSERKLKSSLLSRFFNRHVDIIIPEVASISSSLEKVASHDSEYYKLPSVPIFEFLSQDFMDNFIKLGQVTALSYDCSLDVDPCFVITPSDYFVLSLDHAMYQTLGIVQSPAIRIRHLKDRHLFLMLIHLGHPCFSPGQKNYERAYNQLRESNLKLPVMLSWEPYDPKFCPSSVAWYFHKLNVEVHECSLEETDTIQKDVKFPLFSSPCEDLMEWFGTFTLGIKGEGDEGMDEYLHSFSDVEDSVEIKHAAVCTYSGLITRSRILGIYNYLKEKAKDLTGEGWIGMRVGGFSDTPVCWGLDPHVFHTSGANSYTLILKPPQYILFTERTSARRKP